ncbi:MAG: DUF302 domain-containing protein [Arcobacteraceae bacterium]|nr:DUF302 domain-containing protein [Arcobacteraceae bacterium]
MKKIVALWLLGMFTILFAHDVQIISVDNKDGKITPKTIEEVFKSNGFYISDNRDMNTPFTKQFGQTDFKVYNLFTAYHSQSVKNLAKEYPNIGLLTPMSMSIYTKKGESKLYVSSLTLDAMAKITGISATNKDLQNIAKITKSLLERAIPNGKWETIDYGVSPMEKELVTKMNITLKDGQWKEDSESLIEEFEGNIEMQGFVQAGYNNIDYYFKEAGDNSFDLFVSESICKLPVIYAVAKTRPEAGAFAPCSVMIYKKHNDNVMYVAYPNVYNWISSLTIVDKESLKQLLEAQAKMEVILYNLKSDYNKF